MEMELVSSVPEAAPAAAPVAPSPTEPVAPAPIPEPAAPTPAAATEDTTTPAPAEALYKLPDGREVDAVTLQREWKENFMPEFTQKSQRLAAIERGTQPITSPEAAPKWQDPTWQPQSIQEVIEAGKQAALDEIQGQQRQAEETRTRVASEVDAQIAAIKTKDANLDENALFVHANKFGFPNLIAAYENMSEMRKIATETERRVLTNVNTRKADPISGGAQPAPVAGTAQTYGANGNYSSALDYFRSRGA